MCGWSALNIPFIETRTTSMHGLRINPIRIQFLESLPDTATIAIRQLNSQKLKALERVSSFRSNFHKQVAAQLCVETSQSVLLPEFRVREISNGLIMHTYIPAILLVSSTIYRGTSRGVGGQKCFLGQPVRQRLQLY